jgi:hypothetical protein
LTNLKTPKALWGANYEYEEINRINGPH